MLFAGAEVLLTPGLVKLASSLPSRGFNWLSDLAGLQLLSSLGRVVSAEAAVQREGVACSDVSCIRQGFSTLTQAS